jgi:hypothetical protein
MYPISQAVKAVLPDPIVNAIRRYRCRKFNEAYGHLPSQEIFTKIYESGLWGNSHDPERPFFSGAGSDKSGVISTYLNAVQEFLRTFDRKPNVVDIGCGDFFVGEKIRPFCDGYIACDIVPTLIEFNKERFKALNVDFRVLNLTQDRLPNGDILFIRQVLQHLSNEQISQALANIIQAKYKYLVLTEHLPKKPEFQHNLDKPTGVNIRLGFGSGIVLTSPPFNLQHAGQRQLCKVFEDGGLVATTLYTLS